MEGWEPQPGRLLFGVRTRPPGGCGENPQPEQLLLGGLPRIPLCSLGITPSCGELLTDQNHISMGLVAASTRHRCAVRRVLFCFRLLSGLYSNTELSSTYPARASCTCQCAVLLSMAGTTSGCWSHLMGCRLCGPAGSPGCLPGLRAPGGPVFPQNQTQHGSTWAPRTCSPSPDEFAQCTYVLIGSPAGQWSPGYQEVPKRPPVENQCSTLSFLVISAQPHRESTVHPPGNTGPSLI